MPAITAVNLSQSFKNFCVDHLSVVWGVRWEMSPCTWEGAQNINPSRRFCVFSLGPPFRQHQVVTKGHGTPT